MNDEPQELRNARHKPVLVGPQPFSFEEILRNVDPAPDERPALTGETRDSASGFLGFKLNPDG